jgi:hypothetical protein
LRANDALGDEEDEDEGTSYMTTVRRFFDDYGRRIPSEEKSPVHRETRRYFICSQPDINYAEIHARIKKHLAVEDTISIAEFEERTKAILAGLREDAETKSMTQGVHVPFFLPKAAHADYGQALETIYLPAVQHAFKEKLPKYDFANHHQGALASKLSIAPGSRHEGLLERMRDAAVVGCYFPCLSEYSVPAALEQLQALPEKFLLAGGFDTSAAFIGSPDLLLKHEGYPPLLWLTALLGEKEGVGYHFEAYGYNLTFNRRMHFGDAAEYWCNGLVVLG